MEQNKVRTYLLYALRKILLCSGWNPDCLALERLAIKQNII
jgi:hypothetical protein